LSSAVAEATANTVKVSNPSPFGFIMTRILTQNGDESKPAEGQSRGGDAALRRPPTTVGSTRSLARAPHRGIPPPKDLAGAELQRAVLRVNPHGLAFVEFALQQF
jgi:hypothetical protein